MTRLGLSSVWLLIALSVGCGSDRNGVLYDFSGETVPETAVRLLTINDQGGEISQLGLAVTDAKGRFKFELGAAANASVIVEAVLPEGTLRGFWAGTDSEIPVHPLTEALATLVLDITLTPGGRSVSDFTAEELRDIATDAFDADSSSIDLSDSEGLQEFLRTAVGRQIAIAAGGTIATQTTETFETEAAPETILFTFSTAPCPIGGYAIHPFSSSGYDLGVRPDGSLCGNDGEGLEPMLAPGAMTLTLPEEAFFIGGTSFPSAVTEATAEGGREVVLGPYKLQKPQLSETDPFVEDTLEISRKVLVSTDGDWVRFLEIFSNTGTEDRDLSFDLESTLLTANGSRVLTYDGEGTAALGQADRFLAVFDPNGERATVGFVLQDGVGPTAMSRIVAPGTGGAGEVIDTWDLTVPAGDRRTVLHYLYFTSSQSTEDVNEALLNLATSPEMGGMSLDELRTLANFAPVGGTIQGDAGAVIGEAELTAVNANTSQSVTVSASRDGSFGIPLDTASGDSVHVTASDGLDVTLTVP